MDETLELGGNISLTGFSVLEPGMMIVVKKIVGSYAKKFSENVKGFEKLSLTLKPVHEREQEGPKKFELNAKLVANGKAYTSSITDRSLFIILDKVLKKIEAQV